MAGTGLLATSPLHAKAPVWQVSNGEEYLYLGGTIHLLAEDDYPLPIAFDKAWADSDQVFFEVDEAELARPEVSAQLSSALVYADGRTLQSELHPRTFALLEQFLAGRNIPIAAFASFNPIGASLTLTALELERLGVTGEAGVDTYFGARAKRQGKPVNALESVAEQIGFVRAMALGDADQIVLSTLSDLQQLESYWENLTNAWRNGDMQEMNRTMLQEMQEQFPDIYQLLLVNRNARWMTKILAMLETRETEFVLVGALHMVGEDGLLQQLRDRGYCVLQLD